MPVSYDDLPKHARDRVDAEQGGQAPRRASSPKPKRVPSAIGHCHACGVKATSLAQWGRHQEETGHGRLEMLEDAT